jgi:hypothetical protein
VESQSAIAVEITRSWLAPEAIGAYAHGQSVVFKAKQVHLDVNARIMAWSQAMVDAAIPREVHVPVQVSGDRILEFVRHHPDHPFTVDATNPRADDLWFGQWDNAFDDSTGHLPPNDFPVAGEIFNQDAEEHNFVGADTNRFYLRLTDRSRSLSSAVIELHTLYGSWGLRPPGNPNISLRETASGSGI